MKASLKIRLFLDNLIFREVCLHEMSIDYFENEREKRKKRKKRKKCSARVFLEFPAETVSFTHKCGQE